MIFRLLIHQVLKIALPKALHQVELKLEHTQGIVDSNSVVHALSHIIDSDFAYFP